MKNLCLFATYNPDHSIPYYVQVYLKELSHYFSEIILISTHEPDKTNRVVLEKLNIKSLVAGNEGYDFGMWYKALKDLSAENYERIALVNDSCILFKPLDKFIKAMEHSGADFYGMSLSEAVSIHLQSYFLVLNKKAISPVLEYFNEQGIKNSLSEVISSYEIGLSSHLIKRGLKLSAFVDNKGYKGEFSPYYHLLDHHLKQGIPLIKKKVVFMSYRIDELFTLARMNFRMRPAYYRDLILKDPDSLLDRKALMSDISGSLGVFQRLHYEILRFGIGFLKSLKKLFASTR